MARELHEAASDSEESVENATEKRCDAAETATTSNEGGEGVFCMGNYFGRSLVREMSFGDGSSATVAGATSHSLSGSFTTRSKSKVLCQERYFWIFR